MTPLPPDERLAEIKARLQAATPGEWREGAEGNLRVYGPDNQYEHSGLVAVFTRRSDVQLIAHAPADLTYLLSKLEEAQSWQAVAGRLYEALEDTQGWYDWICHCGHPACKRCPVTKEAKAALAAYTAARGGAEGEAR